jgi:hypothetical protein
MSKVIPSPNVVLLPDLAREIAALTGQPSPPYHQLWKLCADGLLPAEKIRGRYRVDVSVAVKTLGLKVAA